MAELMRRGGEKQIGERDETVANIRKQLSEPGSPSFSHIRECLLKSVLSARERHELGLSVIQKVQEVLEGGHFGDLQGAQPLLKMLGVSELQMAPEWSRKIQVFLNRFDEKGLRYLTPPLLLNDKLPNGRPYERISYARERLIGMGVSPQEATDEFVHDVFKVRELLLKLHEGRAERLLNAEAHKGLTVRAVLQIAEKAGQ